MRIDTEYRNKNQAVEKTTLAQEGIHLSRAGSKGAIALDITGTAKDGQAYADKALTAADIIQEAGQCDTALQKDYLIVMSNSMSQEDFAKLQEDGFNPTDTEVETLVTVVDKIKAELLQAGIQVEGYTDDISSDKLTEITGNQAMAQEIANKLQENDVPVTEDNVKAVKQALDKKEEISELSEGVLKYMIQTGKEANIDHIYKARFSATEDGSRQGKGYYADEMPGYYAKKAEDYHWAQLMPQMEKVIAEADLEVTDTTIEEAKWLVEKGVPLTPEALKALENMKKVTLSQDMGTMIDRIAQTMGEGKTAGETSLVPEDSIYQRAEAILEQVAQIGDQAFEKVEEAGEVFTIQNLSAAQRQILLEGDRKSNADGSAFVLTAKRQMAEIRLIMSYEVNVKLLKQGFQIKTADLEELAEHLRTAKQEENTVLFGTSDSQHVQEKRSLFEEVTKKMTEIAFMPAAVLGKASIEKTPFTLNYVHKEGTLLRAAYLAAGKTYEALSTAPRADLGDSIKKAFRNVDSLLKDIGLEPSESSRRAVRILGYNSMPVNKENVATIQDADETLNRILHKMTPAATITMIRNNINPLTLSAADLEEYLSHMEAGVLQESEKYSKYLYKLEQNDAITESEREAYIGVYRLFRQIEKSDGAVIGSLVNQGAELSFKNLLSAVRTQKQKGTEVTFANETGIHKTKYNQSLVKSIMDNISPEKLSQFPLSGDTGLEALAEHLDSQDSKVEEALMKEYSKTQMDDIHRAREIEEHVIRALADFDQPITIDNLFAADYLIHAEGKSIKNLYAKAKEADKKLAGKLEESIKKLQEEFNDKDSVQNAYDEIRQTAADILEDTVNNVQSNSLDIRSMALTFKQISLAADLAKEENYEIPVQIGEELTSINLRILHQEAESGKVTITMQTMQYGKAAAELSVKEGKVSGYIASDEKEGLEKLKEIEGQFSALREKGGMKMEALSFIHSRELDIRSFAEEAQTTESQHKVSSKELYQVAKIFLNSLQKKESSR